MTGERQARLTVRAALLPALAAAGLAFAAPAAAQVQAQLEIAEEVDEVEAAEVEAVDVDDADDAGPEGVQPGVEPGLETLGQPEGAGGKPGVAVEIFGGGGSLASELVHVPVIQGLFPGPVPVRPTIKNPVADNPGAAGRGMKYFNQFNCIGCHAPNGGGGMGPSLSNTIFIYGSDAENIYLSILQGRPAGMPAWGGVLPDQLIWDLVAYIKSISKDKTGAWGTRIAADGYKTEQVPAEYMSTTNPWKYTQPFSYGQAPFAKPKGAPPLETPTESLPPE